MKVREVGETARPGSGVAKPDRSAVTLPALVAIVRVPVRAPVAVGLKATFSWQEAVYAREPVQLWPPGGAVFATKSPVSTLPEREMGAPVEERFVKVKSTGPPVLLTGTVPKDGVSGVSTRADVGRPVPVRSSVYGMPPDALVRVSVPGCVPAIVGRNRTER